MSRSAWADVAGDLEAQVALALPLFARPWTGAVVLSVRGGCYAAVREMFADPRCTDETRALVREYLTGRRDGGAA